MLRKLCQQHCKHSAHAQHATDTCSFHGLLRPRGHAIKAFRSSLRRTETLLFRDRQHRLSSRQCGCQAKLGAIVSLDVIRTCHHYLAMQRKFSSLFGQLQVSATLVRHQICETQSSSKTVPHMIHSRGNNNSSSSRASNCCPLL